MIHQDNGDRLTGLIRYTGDDLLGLTPGKRIEVYVSQENIDIADAGDKRNCAFVRAVHSAVESCERAEVAGNHVHIWIKHGDDRWMLEFYMTEEVWNLANMFDKDRDNVHPATIPIHFRLAKQTNRARNSSRNVYKNKPDAPGAKLVSQVLADAKDKIEEGGKLPVVKPISVPGQRAAALKEKAKSRWAREDFIISRPN